MAETRRPQLAAPVLRAAAAVLVTLSIVLPAAAQSTFYEAYKQGIEHERSGQWAEAIRAFETAARLRPEPAARVKTYGLNFLTGYDPYFHLARAEIALGLFDEAEKNLERSARAGVSPAAAIDELSTRLEAGREAAAPSPTPIPSPIVAQPTPVAATPVPTTPPTILDLGSNPPGADVFVDGRLVGTTPVELPLVPGLHRLELRRQGFVAAREEITLAEGKTLSRTIRLEPQPTPVTAPPPPVVPSPRPTRPPVATATSPPVPSPTATSRPTAEAAPVVTPEVEPAGGGGRSRAIGIAAFVAALVAGLAVIVVRRRNARRLRALNETPTRLLSDTTPTIAQAHATPLPKHVKPKFGNYRLKAMLGRGGMATTYLARRKRDGRLAAIKIPHDHLLESEEFVQRFVREGSLGATAHHPNIIRIFEAGRVGDCPFIAMEFLDGITLEQRIASEGAMTVRHALETARSIALALDYAHMKGIIHRDLKPENVMLLADGRLKVMDYGIARVVDDPGLTGTNTYLGTPLYSAPESMEPAAVDSQSDLYSLGIILYRLLGNRLPFESQNPIKLLELHRSEPLPPFPPELRIPQEVAALVWKLTAKDKNDRYPTAEAFLQDVNRVLNVL
jgi:hypothetical protein